MATDTVIRIICFGFAYLIFLVETSKCLNLGLISGDLKRSSSPLFIKKTSHHSPITINIRPGINKPPQLLPPILPPILSLKPPPTKTKYPKLLKLPKVPILPKLPKTAKLPKFLPKLPLLPIIPPILPPLIPKFPILPILPPFLPPIIPGLTKLKPIGIPIIGKTKLQKALNSELKSLKLPITKSKSNKNILNKLLKLKRDGSLTTSQFNRFKKLLL